jgi:3-deoxy-manno-octulosonate cytidylyltransferase (CMP-KDO synthetase)
MKVAAVIPARYASSRFPGKALVEICGKPMLQHVYEQTAACKGIDLVLIATDDERILSAARAFGARAVMTSPACTSGTDRVAEAAKAIQAEAFINIQGDQVRLDRDALFSMADELKRGCPMITLATPARPEDGEDPHCVKIVVDARGYALYFSRTPIPYAQSKGHYAMLKHVGIYGFSRETLFAFASMPPSPLELTESLEQLRALENGIPIKVIISHATFFDINTPQDREKFLRQWPQ